MSQVTAMPLKSAVFRGDNEELLDHLLLACHGHKMNKPLESCGRDLVPFFAPGESLEPNQVTRSCGSPPRASSNNNNNNKKSRKASPTAVKAGRDASVLSSLSGPASPVSYSPIAQAAQAGSKRINANHAKVNSLAKTPSCPGHFSSPKPTDIPLPSTGFLCKALVVPIMAPGITA